MANPNFHKIKKIAIGRQLTKVKYAYIWKNGQFERVWSGASEVSYYDGDTLLGMEEVDDGADALHPSVDTTKSGYTLYGWSTKKNPTTDDRVTTYLADGDPKTLYAIYVPNSIVVASGYIASFNSFATSKWDSKYVSGSNALHLERTWSSEEQTATFSLNKGVYQNASVTVSDYYGNQDTGNLNVGSARFDGTLLSDWNTHGSSHSKTFNNVANGSHSLQLYVISYDYYKQDAIMGVTNITLSNPEAWV